MSLAKGIIFTKIGLAKRIETVVGTTLCDNYPRTPRSHDKVRVMVTTATTTTVTTTTATTIFISAPTRN